MNGSGVRFIRKGGRIIPIRAARTAATAADVAGLGSLATNRRSNAAPHTGLSLAGTGLAVASGALAAATTFKGLRIMGLGIAGSLGLDVASSSTNIAAYARGKGNARAKIIGAARQEGINTVIGNAVFAGGLLAQRQGREALAKYAGKLAAIGRKALRLA